MATLGQSADPNYQESGPSIYTDTEASRTTSARGRMRLNELLILLSDNSHNFDFVPSAMEKEQLKSAISTIWTRVYRSTQDRLDASQIKELKGAIEVLGNQWDKADLMLGKANFVADCAQMHLDALTAIPERKPSGWNALIEDCQFLQRYLDSKANP